MSSDTEPHGEVYEILDSSGGSEGFGTPRESKHEGRVSCEEERDTTVGAGPQTSEHVQEQEPPTAVRNYLELATIQQSALTPHKPRDQPSPRREDRFRRGSYHSSGSRMEEGEIPYNGPRRPDARRNLQSDPNTSFSKLPLYPEKRGSEPIIRITHSFDEGEARVWHWRLWKKYAQQNDIGALTPEEATTIQVYAKMDV